MKGQTNISRRTFCGMALLAPAVLSIASSCEKRIKVFKYPENAEEIADFNEFFTAPDMTEAEIIKRLNITGEPKITDLPTGYGYKTFSQQSELISRVEFHTYKTELNGLWIKYAKPVPVSMGRLSGLLGAPAERGMVVGKLEFDPRLVAANVAPGHTPRPLPPETSFRYNPPSAYPPGEGFKGEITVDTDGIGSNIKGMEGFRLYRLKTA